MTDSSALARDVRRLALPAIAHSLLQTLVFVVDRIMLGHHNEASLAAMQIGGTLEWSIWSVFAAFEVGALARIGRHVGARDRPRARRALLISLAIALGGGLILSAATPLILSQVHLITAQTSPAALAEAKGYLGVTLAASPVVFVSATSVAALQASGDTRTPLAIGVVANVVHVAANRVLILGLGAIPAMGARGAGISTALTFGIEAALATLALSVSSRPVSLRRSAKGEGATSLDYRSETYELFRVGLPALAERVLYHVGFMIYAMSVTRLGDAAMAANQSLISVESICFLSGDGFGVAAAALVAQNLGANRPDHARQAARIAAGYATVTLTVFGVLAFALRGVILPIFTDDHEVFEIGRRTIVVLAFAQPFMAMGIVLAQALRGAGRTRTALGVSLMGAVFVRLSATWLFAFALGFGLRGVWMGSTTDWLSRAVVLFILFGRPWRETPREEERRGRSGG